MMRSHLLLRSTRRGWFLQADLGGGLGGGAAAGEGTAAPGKTDEPAKTGEPVDYKALLLAILSLPPEATDAEISAKQGEISGTLGSVGELQTQASSAADLQRQLDETTQKFNQLYEEQTALQKQKAEADADEILKVYAGYFTDETSKAAIRTILLSDKDAGIAILNGLKKPESSTANDANGQKSEAASSVKSADKTPPPPKHDPAAQATAVSEEERAAKISARAREIVKTSNPKISLNAAYQQAETEMNAAAA